MAVYPIGMGDLLSDITAQARAMQAANAGVDWCAAARAFADRGMTAQNTASNPPLSAAIQQTTANCVAQRKAAASSAPLVDTGPTLGLRRLPTGAPSTPSTKTPCEVLASAQAMGQAPVIVNALRAKCEAFKAAGGVDVSADAPSEGGGISPIVIGLGVLVLGAGVYFATR